MTFEFFIPGIARTSGSHKTVQGRITHAGDYTKQWMDTIGWFVLKEVGRMCLLEGPIKLTLIFYKERPQGDFRVRQGRPSKLLKSTAPPYPIKRPDLTKLIRAAEDALTKVIWKDDSQVVVLEGHKEFCSGDQKPGVYIKIEEVVEDLSIYEPSQTDREPMLLEMR